MNVRQYQLAEELGRGTYGVTYLGYDTANKRNVAIKTIDIAKSKSLGANLSTITEEIDVLKVLAGGACEKAARNPRSIGAKYVACYYDSFQDNLNGTPTIFIVSEYITGGSLTNFIDEYNGSIPPSILWPLFLQLLLGLKYIHESGYAHRDIKPDNILITEDYTIKYIDFGIACLQKCNATRCVHTCKGSAGTVLYLSPEFFNKTRVDSLKASQAHDIWSLAVVMFEMTNGSNVFPFQISKINSQGQVEYLSMDETTPNIAIAPQFASNYQLDDGRTNDFLSDLLINDWTKRPDIQAAITLLVGDILSKVAILECYQVNN